MATNEEVATKKEVYDPDKIIDQGFLYYLWSLEKYKQDEEERENDIQNYWRKDPRFPGPRQVREQYRPENNRVVFPKNYDHFMEMINKDTAVILIT
jgi:hypothetical protein